MKANESQNVEYKRSWHDEYLKWVCGFANAKGGTIWIGIDDDKSVHGVVGGKKLMEDIPNKIKDTMGLVVDVALLKQQKKDVLRITVPESDFPVAYRGEYHYRTGSTKQQLTGFALNVPSDRRNGILADVFDRLDYMEREGSGFKKIVEDYTLDIAHNAAGVMPKFYSAVGYFIVTLPRIVRDARAAEESREKSRENGREKSGEKILSFLRKKPTATQNEIAVAVGLSVKGVEKNLKELKVEGRLRREGSDRKGSWVVQMAP